MEKVLVLLWKNSAARNRTLVSLGLLSQHQEPPQPPSWQLNNTGVLPWSGHWGSWNTLLQCLFCNETWPCAEWTGSACCEQKHIQASAFTLAAACSAVISLVGQRQAHISYAKAKKSSDFLLLLLILKKYSVKKITRGKNRKRKGHVWPFIWKSAQPLIGVTD